VIDFKKISVLVITIILMAGSVLFAQKNPENLQKYDYKTFHFGFTLGVNEMNFRVINKDDFGGLDSVMVIEPRSQLGFNIGIVSSMKLHDYVDLRFVPTLSFGSRFMDYDIKIYDTLLYTETKEVESTYIDFPLTLKLKGKRMTNIRPSILLGGRYSLDLASQSKKKVDQQYDILKLYSNDILFEVGTGFDFYMKYFKFGVEAKMAYGMRDLLKREGNIYTEGVESVRSKIFWLTFTFE
jgi:hypothetical protein